jgi:hypothetical protein
LNFPQDGLAHEMLSGSRIALDTFAMRSQTPMHSFLVPLRFAAMILSKEARRMYCTLSANQMHVVNITERQKKDEGDSM